MKSSDISDPGGIRTGDPIEGGGGKERGGKKEAGGIRT